MTGLLARLAERAKGTRAAARAARDPRFPPLADSGIDEGVDAAAPDMSRLRRVADGTGPVPQRLERRAAPSADPDRAGTDRPPRVAPRPLVPASSGAARGPLVVPPPPVRDPESDDPPPESSEEGGGARQRARTTATPAVPPLSPARATPETARRDADAARPARPLREAEAAAEPAHAITIEIGRIEVVAPQRAPAQRPRPQPDAARLTTLAEHLARRSGR